MTNNPGGVETYLMNFFSSMHKNNEVIFINTSPSLKIAYQDNILTRGGKIFDAEGEYSLKNYATRVKTAKKILQKIDADIVYVNALSVNSAYWVKAAKKLGISAVYHSHNDAIIRKKFGVKDIISTFLKPYNQNVLHYAKCLAVSESASEFMFNNANADIVYNSIDSKQWKFNQINRLKIRKAFRFEDDQNVIIMVARLSEQKNVLRAVRILRKIVNHDESYRCLIVGDGHLKNEMVAEIKQLKLGRYVKLLGRRKDIPELMSGSDLLFLPSLFEGLPFVVIEAQGAGLPVIASKSVVPKIANVTTSIVEIPLEESDEYWAQRILSVTPNAASKKEDMNYTLAKSVFSNEYYDKKIKSIFDDL